MLRKKNKLPADVHSIDFELEYGTATIEVHKDSLDKNDSVLIIDDLIATGGTAEAAAKLVEMSKSKVTAFVFVINLFDLGGSDSLLKDGYNRSDLVIAFGGGILGDLSAFISSITKRGLFFVNIPTTLLAQSDSSIGGKTGVNTKFGKNLITDLKLMISDQENLLNFQLYNYSFVNYQIHLNQIN